jgi:hypothetical protein
LVTFFVSSMRGFTLSLIRSIRDPHDQKLLLSVSILFFIERIVSFHDLFPYVSALSGRRNILLIYSIEIMIRMAKIRENI